MAAVPKAEKSRMHAKQRRTEEAKEIAIIANLLPLPESVKKKLDKASILRLAISFLRLKKLVGQDYDVMRQITDQKSPVSEGQLLLESLGGFFIVISDQEEILFVSENVEKHMGIKQVDMIGGNIKNFVMDKDLNELKSQLSDRFAGSDVDGVGLDGSGQPVNMHLHYTITNDAAKPVYDLRRQFFLRMRCTYQKKIFSSSRTSSDTSSQTDYILLQWTGYMHRSQDGQPSFLAAVAKPLQPTPIMELKMDGNMFISRHSLDLHYMYCDPRLSTILGYVPEEIMGSSMYDYHHPGDLQMCSDCHASLMTAGTSMSKYYRFLGKDNEWCWLQTRATIVYNTVKQPQYIVCMNYIISEKEGRRYIEEHLDEMQTDDMAFASGASISPNHQTSPRAMQPQQSPQQTQQQQLQLQQPLSHQSQIQRPLLQQTQQPLPHHVQPQLQQAQLQQHIDILEDDISEISLDEIQRSSPAASYHSGGQMYCSSHGSIHGSAHGGSSSNTSATMHGSPHSTGAAYSMETPTASPPYDSQSGHSPAYSGYSEPMSTHPETAPQFSPQVSPYSQESQAQVVPSPGSVHTNQSPKFYLPQEETQAAQGGSLWLSVHSMLDSNHTRTGEITPPSLANELEDISMQHCYDMMQQSTKAALNVYGTPECSDELSGTKADWDTCEKVLNKEAMFMFKKMKDAYPPMKRSRSSGSRSHTTTPYSRKSSDISTHSNHSLGSSDASTPEMYLQQRRMKMEPEVVIRPSHSQPLQVTPSQGFMPNVSAARSMGSMASSGRGSDSALMDEAMLNNIDELLQQYPDQMFNTAPEIPSNMVPSEAHTNPTTMTGGQQRTDSFISETTIQPTYNQRSNTSLESFLEQDVMLSLGMATDSASTMSISSAYGSCASTTRSLPPSESLMTLTSNPSAPHFQRVESLMAGDDGFIPTATAGMQTDEDTGEVMANLLEFSKSLDGHILSH